MGGSSTSSLGMGRGRRIDPLACDRVKGSTSFYRLRVGDLGIDNQDRSLDG